MDDATTKTIGVALGRIPSGMFVLTAQHEDRRLGMLASWVQQACFATPMISVAVAKSRQIMPLISESRRFGLCQLAEDQNLIVRKFGSRAHAGEDPFLGFDLVHGSVSGPPILAQAVVYLECDHDLFVGRVVGAGVGSGKAHVHLRDDGFVY